MGRRFDRGAVAGSALLTLLIIGNALAFGTAAAAFGAIAVGLVAWVLYWGGRAGDAVATPDRDQREWLRTTLTSIGDAVIATDDAGNVTFLNPAAEALTGWPQADAAGRPLAEVFRIVNETTRKEVENPALRALRDGVVVGLANHTVLIARDGTERPIDDSAAPIRDGGAVGGAVLVFRDISERKKAQEARARLAAIVESSDDAIVGKTLDGVIQYWNAGAERVFGYPAAEAVGQPITLIIPPERLDEERDIIGRLRRGERVDHFETVRVAKGGRRVDISLTVSPVRDHEGRVIGASKVARDVTDRKRAEAERARLAETLRLALDAGGLGTWEWDPATDGMVLSDRAGEIYGVEPGRPHPREELRGRLHPDHRDRAREQAARAVAARADYDIEYSLVTGRWVAARGRGAFGPDGALTRVIGVVQDVTARKEAEAALRASEVRYRAIVEATPECVKLVGPDGTLLQMNPAGLAMVEGDESALGQCVYNVVAPEDRERFVAFNERVCRGERGTLEFDIVGLRGTRRHMETTAVPLPLPQGGFTHLAVTRDVSARKHAEAALRERDERLQLFLENATDYAVIISDPDDRVVEWLGGAERITGWPAGEALGRPLAIIFTPEDRAAGVPGRETGKAAATGRAEDMRWHQRKDGSRFFAEGVTVSFRGPGGELRGFGKVFRDATDEKRAEAALRQSEERHRALVTATSDVAYRMSADWEVMHPLDGRGLVASTAEPLRGWMDLNLPASEHPRVRAAIRRAVETKGTFELEHRVNRPDGTTGWTFSRAVPILDAAGDIAEWFGAARDVTERKAAEDAVRASEERYRTLFTSIDQGFCVVEVLFDGDRPTDYRFLEANPVFERQTGLAHPVGRTAREIVPDLEGRWVEVYGRVAATGEPVRFVEGSAAMGRWFDVFASRTGGAGSRAVAILFTDVTDRKRAEAERERLLREVEAERGRLADVFQRAPSFMCVLRGPGHVFERANDRYFELLGRRDIIGRPVREALPEVEGQGFFEILDGVYRTGEPFVGTDVRVSLLRGGRMEERVLEFVYQPVRDAAGAVSGVLAHGVDLTDRKRAEDALREADRKKDDFIALLAHELRNPLAPIRNGLQVIRLSEDRAARDRSQRMMDRQLSHMVRMIDDLLDVSRIGRHKMALRRARVTLADVVASAVETARPAVEEAGHELTTSLPPRPVLLDADLTRLSQVLSNLLTNSAKYTERGGHIWLSAEQRGGTVVVTVRDTGIGIPATSLPTIFDMFSQVDRTTERSTGGLGIGLALVKGLVEMHGGTVTVRSDGPGRGSEFTVTLPALADDAGPPPAPPSDAGHGGSGPKRRILVVDDNRDGAESLAEMLALRGNEVETAHDGLEAVDAAERFRPEVILMDVGMPKLNGLDATKRIREQAWGRRITIVALTGWGQDADRERTRGAGCDGHLVKPVNLPDLEKLLEQLSVANSH